MQKMLFYFILFFLQECIKLIKSDNTFIISQNNISNTCCSFELSVYQRILKKILHFPQKYAAAHW